MNRKAPQPPQTRRGKGPDIAPTEEEPLPDNGCDTFNMPNGAKYVGEWKRFESVVKRHGKGVFTCNDFTYEGCFEDDLFHGRGTLKNIDGSQYTGDFCRGTINGKGEMRFIDGSIYDGQWRDGKMHGLGTFRTIKSESWYGMWNNGISSCPLYPQVIIAEPEEEEEEELPIEEEEMGESNY